MELRARELELQRQQFQRQMTEMEQRFHDNQERARKNQEAGEHRRDQRLTIAAIVFAIILGVGQIVAAILAISHDSIAFPFVKRILALSGIRL